ncbi:GNAT family N-acetyltransferase [Halorarum salinum]|uniref:GNAT family N-acetyltransferase n=1 Tax=Halorarum salinum TaxID=2743089 RepID=A0A7D5QIG8_9EURY|nr:GNAT family protein [Halobaculum salinum]QLG63024.1 GNAT family N-acetyltransferase [Halobaculum salinum]
MADLFPRTIETERLRFEPRSTDGIDARELYRICSADPGIEDVTRHVPWDPHEHPRETEAFLERGDEHREEASAAGYVLRPRDGEDGAGEMAGFTGIQVDWGRRRGDLGLWLRRRFWGRGYSGERATALVELAFDRLDLEVVTVGHEPGNARSERAITKYVDRFGGRRDGRFRNRHATPDGAVTDLVRYSISRGEWHDATGGGTAVLD